MVEEPPVYAPALPIRSNKLWPDMGHIAITFWTLHRSMRAHRIRATKAIESHTMSRPVVSEFLHDRLHNRYFRSIDNKHGVSSSETVFHYQVTEAGITGSYQGGRIAAGHQVGHVLGDTRIELLYHCVTIDGELLAGWSKGQVGQDAEGRTTLSFVWGWRKVFSR